MGPVLDTPGGYALAGGSRQKARPVFWAKSEAARLWVAQCAAPLYSGQWVAQMPRNAWPSLCTGGQALAPGYGGQAVGSWLMRLPRAHSVHVLAQSVTAVGKRHDSTSA